MGKNIFITTTLPYCNGNMHVGAAFEFLLADSLNRFFKSIGKNTYLNIGLDQNGSKILAKSKEFDIPVKEYVANISNVWIESCKKLNIEYDNFYQTSTEEHALKVQNIWNYFIKNGDIYQKEYKGKYCIGCESFKLDKDLVNNKCNDHPNTEIQIINETNYFFNLGKYKENIIKWLKSNPIYPENKVDELLYFLNDYEEISVSRKNTEFTYGISVPENKEQIIYVWMEALCNYNIQADKWTGWNNCQSIQLCGPDNLRFQAQVFQGFLAGLEYKNTDKILVHGTILDSYGRKMSKTLGNVIDPITQLEIYGLNAVRYYTLAGLNTTNNSNWDEDILVTQFNSEVCNDWGNLVSRVLHLIDTKIDKSNDKLGYVPTNFTLNTNKYETEIIQLWLSLNVKEALIKTNELVRLGNKYINDEKPWANENHVEILNNLYHLIITVGNLYKPVFPNIDIDKVLLDKKKVILFEKLNK